MTAVRFLQPLNLCGFLTFYLLVCLFVLLLLLPLPLSTKSPTTCTYSHTGQWFLCRSLVYLGIITSRNWKVIWILSHPICSWLTDIFKNFLAIHHPGSAWIHLVIWIILSLVLLSGLANLQIVSIFSNGLYLF